ncbi:MAG: hypothetical protein QF552_05400 [Litorilituus sp.]|nr:hypothetical protein [Litorilituus sp.]
MIISNGLLSFINKAILKPKREHVLAFLANTKNHIKFARTLDHEFMNLLDKSNFKDSIDINSSNDLGFLYCSNGFSTETETRIGELYGQAPWEGGWLIVNLSGTFAIYRPDGKIDDEVFIELQQSIQTENL